MLSALRTKSDSGLLIKATGVIDERADLKTVFGPLDPATELDFYAISHINSTGIKSLMRYIRDVCKDGTRLKLSCCSPAIVEQLNLVPTLAGDASIESICIPYFCEQCLREIAVVADIADIKNTLPKIPEFKCDKCGGPTVFDDSPEEYFSFLSRR